VKQKKRKKRKKEGKQVLTSTVGIKINLPRSNEGGGRRKKEKGGGQMMTIGEFSIHLPKSPGLLET